MNVGVSQKGGRLARIISKAGVRFEHITPALVELLRSLLELSQLDLPSLPLPPELVVTSGSDGVHSPKSKHYTGEAIDLRSKNFPSTAAKQEFRRAWEAHLNDRHPGMFRVLLEQLGKPNEHYHAQVKRGHTFPGEIV